MPPGLECQKSVEKVPKDPKKSQKGLKNECSGTFSTLFGTPGWEAREDLCETFGDFGAAGVETPVYRDCNCKTRPSKTGSWKVLKTAFEKVLRRVLRSCLAMVQCEEGFLEGVLRGGFREGTDKAERHLFKIQVPLACTLDFTILMVILLMSFSCKAGANG